MGSPKLTRGRVLTLGVVVLVAMTLAALHFRHRDSAVDRWMRDRRAQGERLTLEELGLEQRPPFRSPAMTAVEDAQGAIKNYLAAFRAASTSSSAGGQPAGTASPSPQDATFVSATSLVGSWDQAEQALEALEPALSNLRKTLSEPVRDPGGPYGFTRPANFNFVALRNAAQALADAVIIELHRDHRQAALANLLALIQLSGQHSHYYLVVNQMIRNAILNLGLERVWNLLQETGWTEPELAAVQAELEEISLPPNLLGAIEVERALGIQLFDLYRTNGAPGLAQAFGGGSVPSPGGDILGGLQHAVWRGFVHNRDQLFYLQTYQGWIDALRESNQGAPWSVVEDRLTAAAPHEIPGLRWFGIRLPLITLTSIIMPNLSRAFDSLQSIETRRRLAIVALALTRHQLQHRAYPNQLARLSTNLLPIVPPDPYSGQPFI